MSLRPAAAANPSQSSAQYPAQSAAPRTTALTAEAQAAAAALPALILAAERLVQTALPGAHGLRRAGPGDEFWQYRPAGAADDARAIDWRRSGRGDADFVRDRERVSAETAAIWVAQSPGMDWTGSNDRPTKRARAELLGLALAVLLLRGGERVAVLGAPPRTGRSQLPALAATLVMGGPGAAPSVEPDAGAIRPGQRIVLLGDWLDDPAQTLAFIARAGAMGVGGAALQVLDPVEQDFPFAGAVLFRDADQRLSHDTRDAGGLRAAYLDRLAARRAQLQAACDAVGWRFGTHDTAATPAQALHWLATALGA